MITPRVRLGWKPRTLPSAKLEHNFPFVLRRLIDKNFEHWKDHRDLLLRYVQMMRARSLLFFEHMYAEGANLRTSAIEAVSPDRRSLTVRSMTPLPPPDAFIKNWTITEMRKEIQKGPAWLDDFNWALRYCDSPTAPFVISESPLIASGHRSQLADALRDPETLLFFPLCWKACLIGSRQFFHYETDRFGYDDMRRVRRMYRESARHFLLSPTRLGCS